LGFRVLCTDYRPPGEQPQQLHRQWKVQEHIGYAVADVFKLAFPEDFFDVVACKSVIGGLSLDYKDVSTRTLANQKLAVDEIRRVLKPGGIFFGAENLIGTRAHMALRRIQTKGNLGWRYLRTSEIRWLFSDYSACEQRGYGFLGSHRPRFCGLNALCATLDTLLSKVLPDNWLYISFIRARK
jgi:SAM-dependent methyltransferase